jgi:hypothetical protein
MDARTLRAFIKIAQKSGLKSLEIQGVKFEFWRDGENTKAPIDKKPFTFDELSIAPKEEKNKQKEQEDLLFWSSN